MQTMWGSRELLVTWFLVLAAGTTEHVYRPSRRVCTVGVSRATVSETFVQRVYQPYLTTCDGHRTCSTYRTIYRTAYRRSPGLTLTRPRYACCPGWKRTSGLPGACGAAVCQPPCGNGGSCIRPGQCRCPVGWQGDTCQTDVDECSTGEASCPQRCVNTVGSYWCQCWEGQSPSADGMFCLSKEGPSPVAPNPTAGVDSMVREEVYRLQARVDVLEQKLQLVLAPLYSLASRSTEHGLQDPGSLLAHSFQQLDRIDSLSEQVSFLEEQLGSCSCKKDL
ncbi:epidermal growth factor-like protein 7 isoform X5 [Grammomys surdaster]|uniref:epidermal growth factor-like protein 7 isoform X5 n=1 Tax=Grammomys surdaster TaxID=491861 RepID=UPI00109EECB7|nr:epidermal growth factor-like protein 7 isoform X5 [Grammomys surdaster]XP_028628605.1 epidermal growth factor-like protein 7 isoform X5 [Grammomys surdaster]